MIKKCISLLLIVIMVFSPLSAFAYSVPEKIKVGLCFGDDARNSFTIKSSSAMTAGHTYEYNFYPQITLSASSVLVEKGGGAYLKTVNEYATYADAMNKALEYRMLGVCAYAGYIDGKNYVMFGLYADINEAELSKADLEFTNLELESISLDSKTVMVSGDNFYLIFRHESEMFAINAQEGKTLDFEGVKYYGCIIADRINNSGIGVVNLVSYDDYVACVVGSEMYSSWHIEALKSQAVIARTYALTTKSYKKYGIDVTDDTRTQAYKGTSNENTNTRRAAEETSGVVVLYNGSPAQTFFTASSGGKTADVYSAWGGGAGLDYLKSVDDSYEDTDNVATWSVSYSSDEIAQKLAKAGVDIGQITDVIVTDRGEDDERVRGLKFIGSSGDYSVTFEKCRTLLGLKSQFYYITTSAENTSVSVNILSAKGNNEVNLSNINVLGANGYGVLSGQISVLGANGQAYIKDNAVNAPKTFTFDGKGHGHGIGLSQYGAKGMAEAGFGYADILSHYYPGTELSN